jgi:[acyl-carrier-protein] S-malonyltransferase
MGKALAETSRAARDVFARADDALGESLSKLCFEGPEADLQLTANTQPAILTTSIAVLAALREAAPNLPRPRFVAGHSLGEYSALVAAGALDLEDAVRLVRLRGQAMQRAVPEGEGGMAAVMGADADAVMALCREAAADGVLAPANFNGPGQIVIAGHLSAIRRALELGASKKMKLIPLKVSAPFHCPLMAPAAREVEQALALVRLREPEAPVVSNVEAQPNASAGRIPELLVRQIDSPVLWEQAVRFMASAGVKRAFEIGPGKVLSGLVRRIDKSIEVTNVQGPDDLAAVAHLVS